MLGILLQLAISWLLIWLIEKGDLSFMGWKPNQQRLKDFLFFLLLAAACSALAFFLRMYFAEERWYLNPKLDIRLIANGIWYNIKSVLFEELIFRGVLFYLLIRKLGGLKALIISSVAFGIYHWFTYEVFNDPMQMLLIFLFTATAGWVYGLAYLKTGSLYTPAALHFGWNFVNLFVFSNGNIGSGIFIEKLPAPQVQVGYLIYLLVAFLPIILFFLLNLLLLYRRKDKILKQEIR